MEVAFEGGYTFTALIAEREAAGDAGRITAGS
jgi:hypothetical protein